MNMKLYHFVSPKDFRFAQATRHGTWYPEGGKICSECKTSNQKRVSPLIIEWGPGSDVIGDFVWPGLNTDLVVVQNVKNAFKSRFKEIEFGVVEFWQDPKLNRPIKMTHRTKPRVWLSYRGPPLWDVIVKNWVHLDHYQSNVSIAYVCSTCGKVIYNLPPPRLPRHLVIDTETWNGEEIFHIHEYSGAIFCTEKVKEFVERSGFTNVSFIEDGVILG